MTCLKLKIISLFNDLIYICYAENKKGSQFKLKEYNHLIKTISQYSSAIQNAEIVEKLLIESGKKNPKSTMLKIKEIILNKSSFVDFAIECLLFNASFIILENILGKA